jgi:DNA-binding transcriptional LysR family regulator
MNFTHLHAFYEVARAGSVSAGADRMHVSQPAVTREIRALEARLGIALFDRVPRGVVLTEAGSALYVYATRIFALAEAAESDIKELAGLSAGDLRIGASATIGVYLVPDMIARFSARFPKVNVELLVTNTEQVERDLTEQTAKLGFIEGPFDRDVFDAREIGADEIIAVTSASHPLAGRSVTARALESKAVILREPGSGTRAVVEEAYAAMGLSIVPVMSVSNTEAIKRMLLAHSAIAYISALAVKDDIRRGDLVALTVEDLRIERALNMVWLKGRSFSPSLRAFIDLVLPA